MLRIIAISGLFGKSDGDRDILPPPLPFPKIEAMDERLKEIEKEMDNQERQRKKEEKKPILKEIEKEIPKPKQSVKAKVQRQKFTLIPPNEKESLPEMDIIVKPEELIKAEKEIQKAIDGMKEPKKNRFALKGLFKRKEEQNQESIEKPEIMPRTSDKIDYIEFVEERIHKARMAMMNFNFEKAKKIYVEIMRLYNDMSQKEKYQVYQDIKDLYYERKSAESFVKK